MNTSDKVYESISKRTGGDIYLGIVGPVRSGKSSFIRRFMQELILPNIESEYLKERTVDELPQASAGKTIMTTEPKFVPEDAVKVSLDGTSPVNVRLIDCVGYIMPSAAGYIENGEPRMVRTPWFDEEVPFNMAAEIGTQKVICDHSTVGIVVTSDGSITGIDREEYEECEKRVIDELLSLEKPFVILLNSLYPESEESKALCQKMSEEYDRPVIAINCLEMDKSDIEKIFEGLLLSFPIRRIDISYPKWVNKLSSESELRSELFGAIRSSCEGVGTLSDVKDFAKKLSECEKIVSAKVLNTYADEGRCEVKIELLPDLFFEILSKESGLEIRSEDVLLPTLLELIEYKKRFSKFISALDEVEKTGYGIVMPDQNELSLDEPEIIRQGSKFGVKLSATAPSIHLIKTDLTAEVAPIVGSQKQSEELIEYLLNDYDGDPKKLWETNLFGKSLSELVSEGLEAKLSRLPSEARYKLREAVERIVNEGCSGLICLLV